MKLSELMPEDAFAPEDGAVEVRGLTLDSRKVEPGFLFAALPGVKTHGRDFIPQAVAQGAAVILTDIAVEGLDIPVLVTDEPAAVLAELAARFYPCQPEHVVAVTGTNGKSSTVEFLRQKIQLASDRRTLGQEHARCTHMGAQAVDFLGHVQLYGQQRQFLRDARRVGLGRSPVHAGERRAMLARDILLPGDE